MRFALKFVLPLVLVLGTVSYFTIPLLDSLTRRWFVRDLEIRSRLISKSILDSLPVSVLRSGNAQIDQIFSRSLEDERLYAIGLCDWAGRLSIATDTFPKQVKCSDFDSDQTESFVVVSSRSGDFFVSAHRKQVAKQKEVLVLVHDMSFIEKRSETTRKFVFLFFIILSVMVSFITVLIARMSFKGFIQSVRELLTQPSSLLLNEPVRSSELLPLAKEIRSFIRDVEQDRQTRDELRISWNAESLKEILNRQLVGDEVLIVSNRQPYIHNRSKSGEIEVQTPASGLVTALEPIMRACSGTWIAHGNGTADREVVDSLDRLGVPPESPEYRIRRVWLTDEEERGFYYGFSNEGMWPLCHIAHTRPIFRQEDWDQYVKVNQKFADTVVQEAKTDDPVVLVQDYHFALLPKMIREKLPKATIITFWHIPWPNSESFGICPWKNQILEGLLGSSILGFHTRYHCNQFMDSVDRYLEARIDRDALTVTLGGMTSAIKSYPISIQWPKKETVISESDRIEFKKNLGLGSEVKIGLGVDRMDYTKGILERFRAIEKMLDKFPEWHQKFTFIQIAAPTRSSIRDYDLFSKEVHAEAERINAQFCTKDWSPILLRAWHHDAAEVFRFYQVADVCMVTSLHDGMNLVSKEFLSSRADETGVLILSQFTGAARELPEALLVNPYDIDQTAECLFRALVMPVTEQAERMRSMRSLVKEFNVYRWAGRMLLDASRMRRYERLIGRSGE